MNINNKPFLSFSEQIKHLENDKNLKISDKNRLKIYLLKYNYQVVIDGYSTCFFEKNDRSGHYDQRINSDDLINLFEFDVYLSQLLFKEIGEIERRLNTAITYITLQELNQMNYKINAIVPIFDKDKKFCNIINNTINNLFSEYKISKNYSRFSNNSKPYLIFEYNNFNDFICNELFKSKFISPRNLSYFYYEKYKKIVNELNKSIVNNVNNKEILISCFPNFNKDKFEYSLHFKSNRSQNNKDIKSEEALAVSLIPIYKTFTALSFGDLIDIYLWFNIKLKTNLINSFFSSFSLIFNNSANYFLAIFLYSNVNSFVFKKPSWP